LVAQQHIHQEGYPHLPARGVIRIAQKVGELKGLFDLLEEHLDLPSTAVKLSHRAGRPIKIIGQEGHFPFHPVDRHKGDDPPKRFGVLAVSAKTFQPYYVISQNFAFRFAQSFFSHLAPEVCALACDPINSSLLQIV
jgi:hypothetical protein